MNTLRLGSRGRTACVWMAAWLALAPGLAAAAPSPDTGERAAPAPAVRLAVSCDGEQVCREEGTGLAFRVLPRSFAQLYRDKSRDAAVVGVDVRAFRPLYVFAREDLDLTDPAEPRGRYQVGADVSGPPEGWMHARDVMEWQQALIVAYTHPGIGGEGRRPVLMFGDLDDLEAVVTSPEAAERALSLYDAVDRGEVPDGVVSKEPERFVHITEQFYLMPIVDFDTVYLAGDEARYLQLAAAVPGVRGTASDPDLLANPRYRRESQIPAGGSTGARALAVDVVFVMDMTLSMQPYIDRTRAAIEAIARRVGSETVRARLRLGLVGYRDDPELAPGLEFRVRDFTPELVDLEGFGEILAEEARAATVSSTGYPEDLFAGVEQGLAAGWRPDSLRFLCLIGDASGHPAGHPQNATGKDQDVLRQAAQDREVHMLAIQLLNPAQPEDQPLAEAQLSALTEVAGGRGERALLQVDTREPQTFQAAVERISERMGQLIERAHRGALTAPERWPEAEADGSDPDPVQQAERAVEAVIQSALVEYLGKEADPPKDIIVWALDRDLTNPAIRSLEVRVLVTKEQLSSLVVAVRTVLQAMQRAELTQRRFFEALQAVAGQTLKRPEAIAEARSVAEAGLLPAFIESLPYHSEVLSLNDQMYASMTAEQRAALLRGLRAKLEQYRTINEQVDGWVRLSERASPTDKVYPLHLDYLP